MKVLVPNNSLQSRRPVLTGRGMNSIVRRKEMLLLNHRSIKHDYICYSAKR